MKTAHDSHRTTNPYRIAGNFKMQRIIIPDACKTARLAEEKRGFYHST